MSTDKSQLSQIKEANRTSWIDVKIHNWDI